MEPLRGRLTFLIVVLAALTTVVIVQLVRYQLLNPTKPGGSIVEALPAQTEPPMRGRIWDRNGQLLAADESRFMVLFDRQGADIDQATRDLSPALNLSPDEFRAKLNTPAEQVVLARDLPPEVAKHVRELNVWGVTVKPYWKRSYPEGTLAAQVLGFVNDDRQGFYGVEGQYDSRLRGRPSNSPVVTSQPGADLVLTLDRTEQAITEEELTRALTTTGAQSGSIIVMNPRTGEILAMASAPGYDPNAWADWVTTDPDRFVNPAVSSQYEPGSVFKIVTLAAALDLGLVTPETTYNDTPYLEVGGQYLWNWDRRGHGVVTMVDMMAQSLNVGAATLSTMMGQQNFYRYLRAFGIGRLSGIDLQADAAGKLRTRDANPADWTEADLGTNAFGQGLSVTPIQMIMAVAAVANDGMLVQPRVVQKIVYPDHVETSQVVRTGRPISAQTAHTLTNVLVEVVNREVPYAQIPGYHIAGKTGTAQIPIPGGYDDPWTIASFVGYGPASNPQLIVLIKLDRPTTSPYGSQTAAPVFKRLATRLFAVLGIPPDDVQTALTNDK